MEAQHCSDAGTMGDAQAVVRIPACTIVGLAEVVDRHTIEVVGALRAVREPTR